MFAIKSGSSASLLFCTACVLSGMGSVGSIDAQVVVTGAKTTTAASATARASQNIPPGPAPTTPADGDNWYDSTQNAEAFQQSTHATIFRGGAISGCVNVTPATANMNLLTGQNLMSCTIPAGLLNTVGKTLKVWIAGFYTIPAAGSAGTMTMSVQLGSSDICKRTPGTTYFASSTNNPWDLTCYITTQTAGALGKFEAQGIYSMLNNTTQTNGVAVYPLLNTTTVPTGTVDTTAILTLQVVVTFSTNQMTTPNTAVERQLVVEVVN